LNKKDLVRNIAEKHDLTQTGVARVVDAFIDEIYAAIEKGEKVVLPGFGAFDLTHRKAREGRNPATGEPMSIPEKTAPRFAAGKMLKEAAARSTRK